MSENESREDRSVDQIIRDTIKEKKPKVAESSLKTYASIIKNLHKKIFKDKEFDLKDFHDEKKILKYLGNRSPTLRKTQLAAIINICPDDKCRTYREMMMKDIQIHNVEQKKNIKTFKQKSNWLTKEDLQDALREQEKHFETFLKIKNPDIDVLQKAQGFIILLLTSGVYIPPRRSMDWVDMKFKNYDEEKDNVYNGRHFIFNKFKTVKSLGRQVITVPGELKRILNAWIKKIPGDHLLFDRNEGPLNSTKLTQRINRIFYGKHISVNSLRHLFISDKYADVPRIQEMEETAQLMGQKDLLTHLSYKKVDE